jgi:transmembrane sensor
VSEVAAKEMKIPREVAAEAAVWLTRLHGPHRSPELEREFKKWLDKAPLHAMAFERATATWEAVEGISAATAYRARSSLRKPAFPRFAAAGGAAFAMVLIALVAWHGWLRDPVYATDVGEQRAITLADGSRVLLNTRTRLVSHSSEKSVRLVVLEEGEALFEVAKDPGRPFIVDAGAKKITALGTVFTVRRAGEAVSVTLIEGKVSVSNAKAPSNAPEASKPALLSPGERLVSASDAPSKIDAPALDQVLAWKRGEVIFDSTPLSEAVQEMNRYGVVQLSIDGDAGSLQVSGIFRAGDSDAFARAVSSVHDLTLSRDASRLVLGHSSR